MPKRKRPFGPRPADAPEGLCAACHEPFKEGDYTTLIPLGPGAHEEERQLCAAGRTYTAVCAHVHYACAYGEEYAD